MCDTDHDSPHVDPDADSHAGGHDPESEPDDPEEVPSVLVARIRDPEDGPAECTLHPREATGLDLMTTWITAGEGDYVALDEMQ